LGSASDGNLQFSSPGGVIYGTNLSFGSPAAPMLGLYSASKLWVSNTTSVSLALSQNSSVNAAGSGVLVTNAAANSYANIGLFNDQSGLEAQISFTGSSFGAGTANNALYVNGPGAGGVQLDAYHPNGGIAFLTGGAAVPALTITSNGNLILLSNATVTPPAAIATGGILWNSNNALYWITPLHTNKLSAP
jgi:hypothetical protein